MDRVLYFDNLLSGLSLIVLDGLVAQVSSLDGDKILLSVNLEHLALNALAFALNDFDCVSLGDVPMLKWHLLGSPGKAKALLHVQHPQLHVNPRAHKRLRKH